MGSISSFWDDCQDNLKKCGKKTKQSNKGKLWSQPDKAGTLTPNNQTSNSSLKMVLSKLLSLTSKTCYQTEYSSEKCLMHL